jgi:hypothetical protein
LTTATVNVGVTPANDVPAIDPTSPGFDPVAGNYSVTTEEDTPVSGQVVGSDADGDALTYALGSGPAMAPSRSMPMAAGLTRRLAISTELTASP